jgi:hypothetical protein
MHLTSSEGVPISLFYSAGQIYFTGEPCFSIGGTNRFNVALAEIENWRIGYIRRSHEINPVAR